MPENLNQYGQYIAEWCRVGKGLRDTAGNRKGKAVLYKIFSEEISHIALQFNTVLKKYQIINCLQSNLGNFTCIFVSMVLGKLAYCSG